MAWNRDMIFAGSVFLKTTKQTVFLKTTKQTVFLKTTKNSKRVFNCFLAIKAVGSSFHSVVSSHGYHLLFLRGDLVLVFLKRDHLSQLPMTPNIMVIFENDV